MLAVQVTDFQIGPKPASLPKPDVPASADLILLHVIASGLHNVVKARASGHHASTVSLPHIPGVDGVGYEVIDLAGIDPQAEKKYFYFSSLSVGKGSFQEYIVLPRTVVTRLIEDVDPLQCAALVNPVMSSWMALRHRVELYKTPGPRTDLKEEPFQVLVLGATSMSGRMAVRVARHFGAIRVYGAARDEDKLNNVPGLDGHIVLNEASPQKTDFSVASGASVVLDYLYGPWPGPTLLSLRNSGAKHPLTWVNIGGLAGEGELPSAEIRSRDVTFRGSGIGAWDPRELHGQTEGMLKVLRGVKEDKVMAVRAQDVEAGWKCKGRRVVFTFED